MVFPKLSIIIPAYNEEKRVLHTLERYYSFFSEKLKDGFEIIVVPNNCSDRTLFIVTNFARGKKQIKILNIPYYVGKGGAVKEGFEAAQGKFIGFTDADASTSPEQFYKMHLFLKDSEHVGVIGSRKIKGAIILPKRKPYQDLFSLIFNLIVRIIFGLNYYDTQCGAKIFRNEAAKFLAQNLTERAWAFDVEMLYLSKKNKFRIREFPISWTDREGSKLGFFDGIKSVYSLFKIKRRYSRLPKNPKFQSQKV